MGSQAKDSIAAVDVSIRQEDGVPVERRIVPLQLRFISKRHTLPAEWFLVAWDFATDREETYPFRSIVRWGVKPDGE